MSEPMDPHDRLVRRISERALEFHIFTDDEGFSTMVITTRPTDTIDGRGATLLEALQDTERNMRAQTPIDVTESDAMGPLDAAFTRQGESE